MKYPDRSEFHRIFEFAKRADVAYYPYKQMYVARISGTRREQSVAYEFTPADSRLVKVDDFFGSRREEPILLERPLKVQSADDFAWKLFCILQKTRGF
jgi:hypothetical protein